MTSEIGSIQPNPYIFNIENRRKRRARLAHEIGAGARCRKCEDKCPGFQLHFWRKICQNCRCGKDDHEVEDDDEDIGKIVIGKLFERPIRTKEEEQTYSYGTDLDMVNDTTGRSEKLKFDWVPPGVERAVAKRYMEMLPPEKRPVVGSEAAKERRRQLELQIPLYDMDEAERCETLPPSELKNFKKYLEDLRNLVAGQGSVREIVPPISKESPLTDFSKEGPPTDFSITDDFPPPPRGWIENIPAAAGDDPNNFRSIENSFNNNVRNSNFPLMDNQCQSDDNLVRNLSEMSMDNKNPITSTPRHQLSPSFNQSSVKSQYTPIQSEFAAPGNSNKVLPGHNMKNETSPSVAVPSKSSVIHLTYPKPFFAKSEQQNIRPGQFSSSLENLKYNRENQGLPERYGSPEHQYHLKTSDNSGEHNDNILTSKPACFLPQMVPMSARIISSDAEQSPYSAQKEKLIGGRSAIGDNVTILFPQESEVLSSKRRQRDPPTSDAESWTSSSSESLTSQFWCQYCKQSMRPGDVAVICDRAGSGKFWHPQCFVCGTCKELLADLIYFYKDGKVYCGRHYTQAADIPRCKACDELIFGETWTRADNHNWHIHHFCCFICDKPLAGLKYVPDAKDFPHCLSCHMSFKAKMCETCECKISPDHTRAGYNGYFYHALPACFSCYTCKIPLIGRKFKMVKNWVFCSQTCVEAAESDISLNPNPKKKGD